MFLCRHTHKIGKLFFERLHEVIICFKALRVASLNANLVTGIRVNAIMHENVKNHRASRLQHMGQAAPWLVLPPMADMQEKTWLMAQYQPRRVKILMARRH